MYEHRLEQALSGTSRRAGECMWRLRVTVWGRREGNCQEALRRQSFLCCMYVWVSEVRTITRDESSSTDNHFLNSKFGLKHVGRNGIDGQPCDESHISHAGNPLPKFLKKST